VRTWLRQHRQALSAGARRIGAVNVLVTGMALALPAGGYALVESLRPLTGRASLDPQISVFLAPDAKRADAEALGKRLKADARIAQVRFVAREDALKEMSAVQGMGDLVAALGRNPLPDAFIVTARDDVEPLARELAKLPGVAQVQADAVWARRLAAAAHAARLSLALLAAMLAAAVVAVTFNTIRLQILTQREEIEVSKLIGATDAYIRRPFYYGGLLQGIAGGIIALLAVALALALLNQALRPLAESYGSTYRLPFLEGADALAVIAFAGILGWLGAVLSVGRHLREIEPR